MLYILRFSRDGVCTQFWFPPTLSSCIFPPFSNSFSLLKEYSPKTEFVFVCLNRIVKHYSREVVSVVNFGYLVENQILSQRLNIPSLNLLFLFCLQWLSSELTFPNSLNCCMIIWPGFRFHCGILLDVHTEESTCRIISYFLALNFTSVKHGAYLQQHYCLFPTLTFQSTKSTSSQKIYFDLATGYRK